MPDFTECGQSPESRALAERALRTSAVAQVRRAQFELARMHLLKAMDRSEQLTADQCALAAEVQEIIAAVAREERVAGHSPVQMIVLLHEILDEAKLDPRIRLDVEPDLVQWGVEAYFAA